VRDRTAVPPPRDESAGCAEARELRTRGSPPQCAKARSVSATHSPVYPQLRRVLDRQRFASSLRVALRSVDAQVLQRLRPTHPLSPTSAPGLGSPCHISTGTGLTLPHLHQDGAHCHICTGTSHDRGGLQAMLSSKAVERLTRSAVSDRRCQQAAVGADCALHATGRFLSNHGDSTTAD
jgi:hypothetical protein